MKELVIGILFLVIGYLAGLILRQYTLDEIKQGRIWFKLIILISCVGALVGLILRDDVLLFTFLFFIVVTLPSLKLRNKKNYK